MYQSRLGFSWMMTPLDQHFVINKSNANFFQFWQPTDISDHSGFPKRCSTLLYLYWLEKYTSKNRDRPHRDLNLDLPGERQILNPLDCQDVLYKWEKYEIFDYSTISIHILVGKIQNCLAFRADPKMSDLDALIRLY